MSKAGNRGLFEQQNDELHDEIVFDLAFRIEELITVIGGAPRTDELHFTGEARHPTGAFDIPSGATIATVRCELEHAHHTIEKPVRGARDFLIGFADIFATWEEVRKAEIHRPASKDVAHWLRWIGYDHDLTRHEAYALLVEVKTGKLRAGEALRQLKAYHAELRPRPGNLVLAVDTEPSPATLRALKHEKVRVVQLDPGGPITPLNFDGSMPIIP